jgi:hypothetical protein
MADSPAVSDIERAIDRIRDRLRRVGVRDVSAPKDTRTLDELVRAIQPLRLPDDVLRWWRTVDVDSLPISAWLQPCTPEFALETWRSYQDEFVGVVPRCLVPVAAGTLSVEADQPGSPGGEIIRWSRVDGGWFRYMVPTWSDLLECYVDVIDAGAYEVRDGIALLEDDIVDGAARARSSHVEVTDRYPAREMLLADASQWPGHWQRSNRIDPADRAARGGTLTIADVHTSEGGTSITGTIVGRVVWLAGNSDGRLVTVDDGTGSLDVWCPAQVCLWGPVLRRSFEFDVVAAGGSIDTDHPRRRQLHRDTTSALLASDMDAAQQPAAELASGVGSHRASAVASAVRPVD